MLSSPEALIKIEYSIHIAKNILAIVLAAVNNFHAIIPEDLSKLTLLEYSKTPRDMAASRYRLKLQPCEFSISLKPRFPSETVESPLSQTPLVLDYYW